MTRHRLFQVKVKIEYPGEVDGTAQRKQAHRKQSEGRAEAPFFSGSG